jgi:hypothetical protein
VGVPRVAVVNRFECTDTSIIINLDKVYVDEKHTLTQIVISTLHENEKKNNNKQKHLGEISFSLWSLHFFHQN